MANYSPLAFTLYKSSKKGHGDHNRDSYDDDDKTLAIAIGLASPMIILPIVGIIAEVVLKANGMMTEEISYILYIIEVVIPFAYFGIAYLLGLLLCAVFMVICEFCDTI